MNRNKINCDLTKKTAKLYKHYKYLYFLILLKKLVNLKK